MTQEALRREMQELSKRAHSTMADTGFFERPGFVRGKDLSGNSMNIVSSYQAILVLLEQEFMQRECFMVNYSYQLIITIGTARHK